MRAILRTMSSTSSAWRSIGAAAETMRVGHCVIPTCWNGRRTRLEFLPLIFMPMDVSRKRDRGTTTFNDGETAMAPCPEPSVDEMVDDPIVRALMAADGVNPRQLRRLLRSIA